MSSVSFSVIENRGNTGAAIRSGDTVILKVIRSLAGLKWQVSHNGRLMTIQSTVQLEPGSWIRTKAEITGNKVLLRLAAEPEAAVPEEQSARGSFSTEKPAAMLIQAFRRASLQIDTHIFKEAAGVFKRTQKRNRTTASILSALAEKSICPEAGMVDYIGELLDASSDRRQRGSWQPNDSKKQEHDLDDEQSLAKQLQRQVVAPAENAELIHLFNHLKGRDENWILIPYAVKQKAEEVSGTIRLRVSGTGEIRKVAMDAFTGDTEFTFSMVWPMAERSVIKVGCSDRITLQEFMRRTQELPEKLRNLNSVNDDTSIDGGVVDGLSLEEVEPFEGVDKFA